MAIKAEDIVTLTVVEDGASGLNGEDATVLRIDSTRGTVFKNNQIQTVLEVIIYKGPLRISTEDAMHSEFGITSYLQWYQKRINDTNWSIISAQDARLSAGGFNLTLTTDDVDTKVVFMCELII